MRKRGKTRKTILSWLLILTMLLSAVPAAFAADSGIPADGSDRAVPAESLQGDITGGVNPLGAVPSAKKAARSLRARALPSLSIDSVEVINGGSVQILYRDDKVSYDAETGKYYTTERNASMSDARRFTVSAVFENTDGAGGVMIAEDTQAAYDAFLNNLSWTYGHLALSAWLGGTSFSGAQFIRLEEQRLSKDDEGNYQLTAVIQFDTPFAKSNTNAANNIPYNNYSAIRQSSFGAARILGIVDTYDLAVTYRQGDAAAQKQLGATPVKLTLYDSFYEWSEMAAYAEALQAESEAGDGYINGRYVNVEIIGYTDIGTPIWNVVVADSKASVDEYLTVTKPMMENEPMTLKSQLAGGNQKIPLYFNNIHPDETPGADSNIETVEMLLRNDEITYEYHNEITDRPYSGNSSGYATRSGTETTAVTYKVADVLDKFIIVSTLTSNPDGRDKMTRVNAAGFDLNRLSAYQSQSEAVILTSDILKWNPLTMAEYHGYVTGMLLEPCTGPHDPNYEYDLLYPYMRDQAYKMGQAIIGNTPLNRFLIPAEHYRDGWDDGGPMYSPVFAMLFGVLGYTIEIPYANQDSVDACNTATKALIYDCLVNRNELYANKLNYFQRGIDNADLKDVTDPYFTDPYTTPPTPVGRPRTTDENGNERNFFPEYYIIPVDARNQYNIAEAYRTMAVLERNSVKLQKTTAAVTFEGVTYPEGSYIVDMHQFTRGYINSMLSGGYDASTFASMYAEITIDFPDLRGFAIKPVWAAGLFADKTVAVDPLVIPETLTDGATDYVAVKNVSQDVVKLINKLLDNEKPVYMITGYTPEGKIGDFIVRRADLATYKDGLFAVTTDFNGADITTVAKQLVQPKIAALGSPVTPVPPQGSATPLTYILDSLGFDYQTTANAVGMRADRNIVVSDNINYNGLAADIANGIPYVGVRANGITAAANLPNFSLGARTSSTGSAEAVLKMDILPSSPLTSAFAKAEGAYLVGSVSFGTLPDGAKKLMTVIDSDDNFKGGWWRNNGAAGYNGAALRNRVFAAYGLAGENKDVPVTLFGSNIFNKAHAQMYYPILATAIFMGASDIIDVARPYVTANIDTDEVADQEISVALGFFAEDTVGSTATLVQRKYKVTLSSAEEAYTMGDAAWKDYAEDIVINTGEAVYVHWYAENSNGVSSQGSFGPYTVAETASIGTPVFTDDEGTLLNDLTDETLAVSMKYRNDADQPENLTLYLAVYTPDGKLLYMNSNAQSIAAEQQTEFKTAVNMPENTDGQFEDGYRAYVFLWDSDTFVPVTEKYLFE